MAAMFHSVEVAKTHEIMARYRPIAPRPPLPQPPLAQGPSRKDATAAVALNIRGRKRGRVSSLSLVPRKRQKAFFPVNVVRPAPPAGAPLPTLSTTYPPVVATFSSPSSSRPEKSNYRESSTLNLFPHSPPVTETDVAAAVPVEQDLLKKLQEPRVIIPQPVRPVGSSISVGFIKQLAAASGLPDVFPPVTKMPEEVEEEIETDELPAIISDSHNRVRLANSAYKEMLGQPECPWLDAIMDSVGGCRGGARSSTSDRNTTNRGLGKNLRASRRIIGEVMLDVEDSSVPKTSIGFSCRVKIEWACNGRKNSVNAPCDVTRLFCKSKDYMFAWRFHTSETSLTTHCCACA